MSEKKITIELTPEEASHLLTACTYTGIQENGWDWHEKDTSMTDLFDKIAYCLYGADAEKKEIEKAVEEHLSPNNHTHLKVKDLKNAFGDKYDVINRLVDGKPDNFTFFPDFLACLPDYFVSVLWGKDYIKNKIDEYNNSIIFEDDEEPRIENNTLNVEKVFACLNRSDLDACICADSVINDEVYHATMEAIKKVAVENVKESVNYE